MQKLPVNSISFAILPLEAPIHLWLHSDLSKGTHQLPADVEMLKNRKNRKQVATLHSVNYRENFFIHYCQGCAQSGFWTNFWTGPTQLVLKYQVPDQTNLWHQTRPDCFGFRTVGPIGFVSLISFLHTPKVYLSYFQAILPLSLLYHWKWPTAIFALGQQSFGEQTWCPALQKHSWWSLILS